MSTPGRVPQCGLSFSDPQVPAQRCDREQVGGDARVRAIGLRCSQDAAQGSSTSDRMERLPMRCRGGPRGLAQLVRADDS